ncbi:hypothetical protein DFH06DRAFT_1318361 [Mycena polygramma]|nr:hypothetical protein DFH06DRAFT_1318361 [Mycena polygramma]
MDSGSDPLAVVSSAATAQTEYASATSRGLATNSVDTPVNDSASDPGARSPEPPLVTASPARGESPALDSRNLEYSLYHDNEGRPYLRDTNGVRYALSAVGPSSDRPSRASPSGVPMHHSTLFSTEPSTESVLSESSPGQTGPDGYPPLALDIDPGLLSTHQISQLNAIRGHLGTANSRVLAATAILAEHQAATEDVHDAIQAFQGEVLTRVDSLRNDVNSQCSRLNRVLDDNLRLVVETGASGAQVKNLLLTMNRNGGAHRSDRPPPPSGTPLVAPAEAIPSDVRAAVDAIVPPRAEGESTEAFERRAQGVLRSKTNAIAAFPLPSALTNPASEAVAPRVARFIPPADYESVGSSSRAHLRYEHRAAKSEQQRIRMLDDAGRRTSSVPVPMNNSHSAYVSSGGGSRDILTEFADDAAEAIRDVIESKLGIRISLPSDVRTPRVSDPVKYRGQDDHDVFMMEFLEKLLGWMRSNNFGGPDLDNYRVVLLQNYLDGEAHRWYVTETRSYSKENGGDLPEFADIICAMHRRFIKSSSAQRATRAFESVTWDPVKGPEQLYSDLKDCGERMVEEPAPFVFRQRFLKTLPKWISNELRLQRGVTAEFSDYELMRTHARQMWEVDHAIKTEESEVSHTAGGSGRARDYSSSSRDYAGGRRQSDRHNSGRNDRNDRNPRQASGPVVTDRSSTPRRDDKDRREDKDRSRNDRAPAAKASSSAGCFNCGGTDHYARDKKCPKYEEYNKNRERPRVAAQRVLESYSDEDTDEHSSDYESGSSSDSDPNIAPDLDDLLARAEAAEADVRVAAMHTRPRVHYYSMRVVEDVDDDVSETESSVTASSLSDREASTAEGPTTRASTPTPFGYNSGPVCVVCRECKLVTRQLSATPENGLITDREYAVCQHLANVGSTPSSASPTGEAALSASTGEEVSSPTFEGYALNWLGDPDFESGIIIDITAPMPIGCRSATDEILMHEQMRNQMGLRPLTALEYDANLRWLTRYRSYDTDEEDMAAQEWEATQRELLLQDPVYGVRARGRAMLEALRLARVDEARLSKLGPGTIWTQEPVQRIVSSQLGDWAPVHEYNLRAQDVLRQAVCTRRLARSAREWMETISAERRELALANTSEPIWNMAYWETRELSARLSESLEKSRIAQITARYLRDESRMAIRARRSMEAGLSLLPYEPAQFPSLIHPFDSHLEARESSTPETDAIRATVGLSPFQFYSPPPLATTENTPALRRSPGVVVVGQEDLGVLPIDEAGYWVESVPFSDSEIDSLAVETPITDHGPEEPTEANPVDDAVTTPPLTDEEEYDLNNAGHYTWAQEQQLREEAMDNESSRCWLDVSDFDSRTGRFLRAARVEVFDITEAGHDTPLPGGEDTGDLSPTPQELNRVVRESYDSCTDDAPVCPGSSDELLFTSLRMTGKRDAERVRTLLDKHGNVYWKVEDLPRDHFLHPEFRGAHEAAVEAAIREHERSEPTSAGYSEEEYEAGSAPREDRERYGLPDSEPRLLPGRVFHDRIASLGPEDDSSAELPGFRIQFLSARIEHSGHVRRPEEVGLLDQPTRSKSQTACISALLNINGTQAYSLIDTGSTTNSVSPEFAHATKAPRIALKDQVTLQLGCVGSRSRINYGTRVPVDFGGIKGYVYFDQVNLDRYDCIIGTPFLNRHGAIIDFATRELRFPNGNCVPALPLPEETDLIAKRNATRKEVVYGKKSRQEETV